MDFKRDLLKSEKRSTFRMVCGILLIAVSIVWMADKIMNARIIRPFDWLFFGVFMLNGIVHSVEGSGFAIARLFGKAFIWIDEEKIVIKTSVLAKQQRISWMDIKSIANKPVRCQISKIDGTSVTLNLSKLEYVLVKEIKSTINDLANKKGLEVT